MWIRWIRIRNTKTTDHIRYPSIKLIPDADLIAELVDELIEAEVDLGLHLVVEELLLEDVEGVEGGVVVQVQRVQHALHVRRVLEIIKLNSN